MEKDECDNNVMEPRSHCEPRSTKILFVSESLPKEGYFYDKIKWGGLGTATKEAFQVAFDITFKSKEEFLEYFKSKGCCLVDLFYKRGQNIKNARTRRRGCHKEFSKIY